MNAPFPAEPLRRFRYRRVRGDGAAVASEIEAAGDADAAAADVRFTRIGAAEQMLRTRIRAAPGQEFAQCRRRDRSVGR